MFTRLLYYGISILHLSIEEVWLMPFGLLMDLWECHRQYTGQAKPLRGSEQKKWPPHQKWDGHDIHLAVLGKLTFRATNWDRLA